MIDLAATFIDYASTTTSTDDHYSTATTADERSSSISTIAGAYTEDGMTSQSLRKLLEVGYDETYHSYVSSGSQSMSFWGNTENGNEKAKKTVPILPTIESTRDFAWRLVVDSKTGLKLICCLGNKCIGQYNPSITKNYDVGGEQQAHNEVFTEYLFNTTNDPFDLYPLNINDIPIATIDRLRSLLPLSFAGCGHSIQEASQL